MPKLNDMQLVLLTAAAQRESGSAVPFPASVTEKADQLEAAIRSLLSRSLVEERPVRTAKTTWRNEDDNRFGLFITDQGRAAINVEKVETDKAAARSDDGLASEPAAKPERQTKSALVVELLERAGGATLPELVAATGWQPHTTRAALTGLRKKGFAIDKNKRDDVTCYRVAPQA